MQTTEVIPVEEIKGHQTSVEKLKEQMSAIKVTSQDELTAVARHINTVKNAKKAIKEARDRYINPAKEIIDRAKADFDPIMAMCDEVEAILKKEAEAYMLAEAKKVAEAKEKEIKKVESGYQKPETAAKKIEEIKGGEKKVDTGSSTLSMKMVKDYKVVDEKKIPDEYWKPRELDLGKLRKIALAEGVGFVVQDGKFISKIPGIEIFEKPEMNSRAK